MGISIDLDGSDLIKNLTDLYNKSPLTAEKSAFETASEILRLSQAEVPHDIGLLQNSGHVEPEIGGAIVGYNKVYAARLHENPQYNFKNGRKGKYLEDPIKQNMSALLDFIGNIIGRGIL